MDRWMDRCMCVAMCVAIALPHPICIVRISFRLSLENRWGIVRSLVMIREVSPGNTRTSQSSSFFPSSSLVRGIFHERPTSHMWTLLQHILCDSKEASHVQVGLVTIKTSSLTSFPIISSNHTTHINIVSYHHIIKP